VNLEEAQAMLDDDVYGNPFGMTAGDLLSYQTRLPTVSAIGEYNAAWMKAKAKILDGEIMAALYNKDPTNFATQVFPFLLEGRSMTSEQAWKTLKDLRYNRKRKLYTDEKRALEYAMVRICEEVGKRVLTEKEGSHA